MIDLRMAVGSHGVGNTPIAILRALVNAIPRTIFLKLEGCNRTGSIKDRTAMGLMLSLLRNGMLSSSSAIVESTSGNLGVALAALAGDRGLPFIAVIDPKISPVILRKLVACGARIEMVEAADDAGGYLLNRLARVNDLCAQDARLVWTNQYGNRGAVDIHCCTTGPELYAQIGAPIEALFVAVSTAGTLAGLGCFFRRVRPNTRIIAVDAVGSMALGGKPGPRNLTGIGSSRRSSFKLDGLFDELVSVSDDEAFSSCRGVNRATGINIGGSAGAVLAAAIGYLATYETVRQVVCISPDCGENYSETIYENAWLKAQGHSLQSHLLSVVEDMRLVGTGLDLYRALQ